MDLKLNERLAATKKAAKGEADLNPERLILTYWTVAIGLGALILWDWISVWNVPKTLQIPWLPIYLVCSFALSQVLYSLVARHEGRPVHWGATAIFALGNGIAETLAFAAVYRIGEVIGSALAGLAFPSIAGVVGFLFGTALFVVYGGLIHGFFWLQVLPPHLDDAPRSRLIRKYRPLAEMALVSGWSLCFWLTRDVWTVILFHILVDIGLMLKVRPPIFGAASR